MPRIFPALAAVLLLLSPAARAADAPAITVAKARAAVDQAADIIGKNYVFPEKRAAIVAKLKANEAAGRYDVTDPFELETRLSPDLSQAGGDKHLWIKFDPAQSESLRKPLDANHSNAFFVDRARRRNQGYVEMKVLPGNLRYVDLAGFEWSGAETVRIVADVARFMAGGDAVILDLRHNGGGSGEAVQALVSYFLPPDGRVLMTFHEGANGHAHSTHVLNKLAGPRMVAKPLYVLTSGHTASAAEEFAYHVQQFHLGTLVGETTAGAANNNTLHPVDGGFVLSVSEGRPVHPVSGTNWEGAGVPPDVAVPVEGALDEAQLLALKKLAAAPGADAALYAWAIEGLAGKLHPPLLDATALAAYVGTYGERTIRLENGGLVFQRGTNPSTALTPLGPDLFAFGNTEDVRARFRRTDGRIVGFQMITADGQVIPVDRTD